MVKAKKFHNNFLSPSSLNIFKDCPRCFWLDKNKKVKRPRGIFPSLPGGMDLRIKDYIDRYRGAEEIPPELEGKIEGHFVPDISLITAWRSWKETDLSYEDMKLDAILVGALDDCVVDNNLYAPFDYKTRGSKPLNPKKYYQTQLDCYCLMLDSSGYPAADFGYLFYYYPTEVKENGEVIFTTEVIKIETDIENAKDIVKRAVETVNGDIPDPSGTCDYCNYHRTRKLAKEDNEKK